MVRWTKHHVSNAGYIVYRDLQNIHFNMEIYSYRSKSSLAHYLVIIGETEEPTKIIQPTLGETSKGPNLHA